MKNYKEIKLNGISIPEKYIKPSLIDNLKYINDTVSHIEINRIYGAGDIKYQVIAKEITIDAVTGEKVFVIWAVQEAADIETAVQNAKEELENRIEYGFPVLQNAAPYQTFFKSFDEDIKHWSDYDYVIINKNLEVCFKQIENIIQI